MSSWCGAAAAIVMGPDQSPTKYRQQASGTLFVRRPSGVPGISQTLAVDAQRGLRPRRQTFGRDLLAAPLAHAIRAGLSGVERRFDLLRLPLEQVLGGLLQLTLVREIGHVGRMLTDDAQLTGHLTLVAAEGGVVLGLAQRLEILGPLGEDVVGRAVT